MKVLSVIGTRPEAIKLAPVILLMQETIGVSHVCCVSGQHRQLLDQVLDVFDLHPAHDLHVMRPGQDLAHLTQAVLLGVSRVLREERPDWLLVQGDTTTAFAAALAGFYQQVPVAHVEAGLRTGDPKSPWPEEVNRRMVATFASLHFAPTQRAAANLLAENVRADQILVTGNTVIDALHWTVAQPQGNMVLDGMLQKHAPRLRRTNRRLLLVTLHRRENLGDRLRSICGGLAQLAARGDVDLVIPLHPNPSVRQVVLEVLGSTACVHVLPPLDYVPFVALLKRCYLVITDSGGIQEEAPALGKPVVVARDTTERPEALDAGTAVLAGTDGAAIARYCIDLLDDKGLYSKMATASNPFGDGQAAGRIVEALLARHRT